MTSDNRKEYKVLQPIGLSGRREKGEIVKLTDEEAAAFSPALIELITPVEETEADEIPLADRPLDTLKFAELKELAIQLGLETSGSKADLLERITLARQ
jgi:hypothetical protein